MGRKVTVQPRDVGTMGEGVFRHWCSRKGISINDSKPDRMGWDFLVEFEPEIDPKVARDQQHTLKKAFIQVKSSDARNNKVVAKLSALKRLADSIDPSFIVKLEFDKRDDPVRARLLLIEEPQMYAILERIRKAESEGRLDFHKIDLALDLSSAVDLSVDGSAIVGEISSAIPDNMTAHAADKQRWRMTCGVNSTSMTGMIAVQGDDKVEGLIDLFIGRREKLVVDRFVVRKSRFGITLPNDVEERLNTEISISPASGKQVTVRAISGEGFEFVEISATFLCPPIRELPESLRRVRVFNDFFDFTISTHRETDFSISIPPDKKFRIQELAKTLRFFTQLAMPGASLEVAVNDDLKFSLGTPLPSDKLRSWIEIASFANLIATAASQNLSSDIMISMSELNAAFQGSQEMYRVATQSGAKIKFRLSVESPTAKPTSGELYFPFFAPVGDYVFAAVSRADIGITFLNSKNVSLITGRPQIIEKVFIQAERFDLETVSKRVDFHSRIAETPVSWTMKPKQRGISI